MKTMTDLTKLTISQAREGLQKKAFSAGELVRAYLSEMEKKRKTNAYVLETPEVALQQAEVSDKKYAAGAAGALEGIPLGIKDLFCTKGIRTTACSHILDGFVPQYESTVTQKLLDAGVAVLGKLNMDEFAMGGSNETSYYGPVINPWKAKDSAADLVAGGSSGGSAAAVAAGICAAGDRYRYRRFYPPAFGFLRRNRHKTDVWALFALRYYCFCFVFGSSGADCQRRSRLCDFVKDDVGA